jgi:TonB-linked SusC/RagA family outer membrane protein
VWNAGAQETDSIVPGRAFTTTKISNTAAVSTTTGVELDKTVSINLTNSFAGQFTGLSVRESNGLPNSSANWLVRGVGSYGMPRESIAKLYVDGFEVNADYLKYLSPLEIESVSVLKDAAALATFGMRGGNGVIWIETKRGKIGKPTIQVQLRGSLQQAVNLNKALDAYNYASLYNQAVSNDNGRVWTPYYSEQELADYKNGVSPNVNWYEEVLKKTGNYKDANILFNGGTKMARYSVVLTYADQEGLLNATPDNTSSDDPETTLVRNPKDAMSNVWMSKFNLRSNFDFEMFDIFEARVDLGGRIENNKQPNYDLGALMDDIARYPSNIYLPYDNETKTHLSGTALYPNNPVGSVKGLGWRSSRLRILQGNFSLKEKLDFITPGLYLKEAISFYSRSISTYNKTRNYARYHNDATTTTDQTTSLVAGGYGSGGLETWQQYIVSAGYDRSWNKHALSAAAGLHVSAYAGDGRFSYKYHYLNYNGRANYVYDNRYVAELGLSYFGSDSYAPGHRFGFYPTLSAAWIVSNEAFLKNNSAVNFLKLRASAGKVGSADTDESMSSFSSNGRFLYQQYYYYTGGFNSGNTTPYQWNSGLAPMFIANENAFAEKSLKYNIGLEAKLFQKLDVTLDAFLDKRSDILTFDQTVMAYYGNNYYMNNIGRMTNKGFEGSLTFGDKAGAVDYSLFGKISYAKNTIDFMSEIPTPYPYNARTGRALGARIGLVNDGFYQTEDFNADGSLKTGLPVPTFGSVQPGDLKYKDLDNSGYIDETDIDEIGKPFYPELYYSFGGKIAYKGLDFNVMFRGSAGSSVNLLDYPSQMIAFRDNGNAYDIAKGAWAYYPEQGIDTRQSATYPRLTTESNQNNFRTSSFWMKDNNFLRVQYVELGYTLKLKTEKVSGIRFFLNATNPLTWSSLLKTYNMDPESYFGYPALKSYSLGVSVTL